MNNIQKQLIVQLFGKKRLQSIYKYVYFMPTIHDRETNILIVCSYSHGRKKFSQGGAT